MNTEKCGGWSAWEAADASVKQICTKIKPDVEKMAKTSFPAFEAVNYQYQIVAGKNYNIMVDGFPLNYTELLNNCKKILPFKLERLI
ncbi:cystatin-B-like [Astyanax mexicanus]|uniref:Cystatin-B-like n=1 Tax=Astyanax mexicanus TaxID=7994 RepID=A0A8T2MDV2_ASTMX|nr:cystatin-B-like [Astyanax mexicanus]